MLDAPRKPVVAAEVPGAVEAQVDVQQQPVLELQEEVLPVRHGAGEGVAVQQRRALDEPALRAGDREPLPREDVPELAGQPVDGMPFRH